MLKAIQLLQSIGFEYIKRYEQFLMRYTISGLQNIPGTILFWDSKNIADRAGVTPFNIEGISPKATAEYLSGSHGIAVRHAAFCAHPYVSRLTKQDAETDGLFACVPQEGMIRASFGIYPTKWTLIDCLT